MNPALSYLFVNSVRNRLQSQLRRLRTPRYAIGLVLGVGYFWLIFGRRRFAQGANPAVSALGGAYEALAPLAILIVIGGIWLFGGDRSALAFSEAEVSMLFPAPVTRRALILYKLALSQIAIVVNAVIWAFLLRRANTSLPGALSALGVWTLFTTLSLHRMGAALMRASRVEYRAAGRERKWGRQAVVFGIAIAAIGAFVVLPMSEIQGSDPGDPFVFVHDFVLVLQSPGVRTALYPFHLIIAPVFAESVEAWAVAMLPALGIVAIHVWWVVRSDASFEEAAALASSERARLVEAVRSQRTMPSGSTRGANDRSLSLAANGVRSVAIVWKNAIALRRTFQSGALVRMSFMVAIVAAVFGWKARDPARNIGAIAAVMAVMVPVFGVQLLRTDLRSDMLHLPLLKSLPLAGADLVLAEVASVAVPLAAIQFVLLAVAAVAFAMSTAENPFPAGARTGVLLTSPLVLLALNGAICTILNGLAVLFPAWIRLGTAGPGGIEMMGQRMVSTIAALAGFVVLMIIPVALGTAAWFALNANVTVAVTAASLLGAIALASESYGVILALGHAFERAEPQQVGQA
jgi:ABC-2 type transport system permease protein